MRNISRNLLISIAYIAVLMFGLLTQSAQAYAESDNVKTIQMTTGQMPCHQSVDGYSVKGSKCLFAGQASSEICITQAWMLRSEALYPSSNPEFVIMVWRPEIVPVFHTISTASHASPTVRHSRRNGSLAILYCSFQI